MKRSATILFGMVMLHGPFACVEQSDEVELSDSGPEDSDSAFSEVASAPSPLHVDGAHIKDERGRVVLLRGVNTSGDSKVPPFKPLTEPGMLDPLPGWGINTLRLLFTWEAFEPERGAYDESYMQYYEQVVEWAAERGLYVIVDFHQDAYSRFSLDGCGEGFPAWAVSSEVGLKEPDNGPDCESWGTMMLLDSSHQRTWDQFHADIEGAKSGYVAMVATVAERLSGSANVIGYEMINEPWGTDQELAALYDAVGRAIRARHPEAILFVPPHALASSGLADNSIPKPELDNFVYSPHYYDISLVLQRSWTGSGAFPALDEMASHASAWGVPLLLGEYGAPADAGNVEGYMNALYNWLNAGFRSGTQWNYTPTWREDTKDGWNMEDFSIVDDKGQLRPGFKPRPYPVAIAGEPEEFAETDEMLTLSWVNDPSLGDTELFVPRGFADDKRLTTTGGAQCALEDTQLTCSSDSGASVSVTLSQPTRNGTR